MLVGSIFVLIFQVNITWLSGLTSATTVGIVGEAKVVPQWLLNAAFNFRVSLTPLSMAGAALSLAGSAMYAAARTRKAAWTQREQLDAALIKTASTTTSAQAMPGRVRH